MDHTQIDARIAELEAMTSRTPEQDAELATLKTPTIAENTEEIVAAPETPTETV